MSMTEGPTVPSKTGTSTFLLPTVIVAVLWVIEDLLPAQASRVRCNSDIAAHLAEQVKPKNQRAWAYTGFS